MILSTAENCQQSSKFFILGVKVRYNFQVITVDTPSKLVSCSCYGEQKVYVSLQPFSRYTSQQRWNNDFSERYSFLMPACTGFLETTDSKLELLKSTFNAKKNFYAGLVLSVVISAQFTLEVCRSPKSQKDNKNFYVYGRCQSKARVWLSIGA